MASHSSLRRQEPSCSRPNWLELPADVCASILGRLDVLEKLTSAQHVCSTWRRICRDPSMWRYMDIILGGDRHSELYRLAVDLSAGGLLGITIEGYVPRGFLPYMADRSMHLRCLRLVHCFAIYDMELELELELELMAVAQKTPLLEALDLSYCDGISSQAVARVGQLCPLLQSFKLNARGSISSSTISDDEAFAIAKNMCGLHHLQIFGNKLTNVGLIAILDGCQQLESLDMRHCFHVDLDFDLDLERRCYEQIKHFRGPNDCTDDYPFDAYIDGSTYDSDPSARFEESDEDLVDEWMYGLHL